MLWENLLPKIKFLFSSTLISHAIFTRKIGTLTLGPKTQIYAVVIDLSLKSPNESIFVSIARIGLFLNN